MTRGSVEGARSLALQALARARRRPTAELLQLYALEGFLARVASSPHRERLVLKGGVLLAALDARRPTRDIDLLALRLDNSVETVRALVAAVALAALDDGLALEPGRAETIREGDAYAGVRVGLQARLATARISLHVDVNVGDPVSPPPAPVAVPRLLDLEPIELSGYPLAMVLAEKIVTALQRGRANTRWRDFADLYLLARRHTLSGRQLRRSVEVVAEHRSVPLLSLDEALAGLAAEGQPRWDAWRRGLGLSERLPAPLAEVLSEVAAFAGPVVAGEANGATWEPSAGAWVDAAEPVPPPGIW